MPILACGPPLIAEADVQAIGRHAEGGCIRKIDGNAIDAPVDRRRALDVVLDALEADPDARKPGQGEPIKPEIEDLLDARWIEHGDHVVDHGEFGLVRRSRAFAGVVVAHQDEDAAVFRSAGVIGMAEDVACAIDARALAVPDCKNPVVFALTPQLRLLRAPDCGRCKVLVEARLEADVVLDQMRLGALEGTFERSDR